MRQQNDSRMSSRSGRLNKAARVRSLLVRSVTPPPLKLQIHCRTLEPPGQRRNEAVGIGLVVIDVG